MSTPAYSIPGSVAPSGAEAPATASAPADSGARTVADVLAQSQVEAVIDELDSDLVGLAPVKARIRDIAEGIPGAELHDTIENLCTGIANWLRAGTPRHPEAAEEIARRYHPKVIAQCHLDIYREVLVR